MYEVYKISRVQYIFYNIVLYIFFKFRFFSDVHKNFNEISEKWEIEKCTQLMRKSMQNVRKFVKFIKIGYVIKI